MTCQQLLAYNEPKKIKSETFRHTTSDSIKQNLNMEMKNCIFYSVHNSVYIHTYNIYKCIGVCMCKIQAYVHA